MNYENALNERVEVVTRFAASANPNDLKTICMPVKMRLKGRVISFTKMGLRHPTAKGQRMIHVFELTDGTNDYRLEFDAERLTWTLTGVLAGSLLDKPERQYAIQ